MSYSDRISQASLKVSSIFRNKGKWDFFLRKENLCSQHIIRLHFFLTDLCIKNSGKKPEKNEYVFSPLISLKIEQEGNSPFLNMVEHADSYCLKKHALLLSCKQTFSHHRSDKKKVVQWRLMDYLCALKELETFLKTRRDPTSYIFRYHWITLIQEKMSCSSDFSAKEVQEEIRRQQARWQLWPHHADGGSSRISPV